MIELSIIAINTVPAPVPSSRLTVIYLQNSVMMMVAQEWSSVDESLLSCCWLWWICGRLNDHRATQVHVARGMIWIIITIDCHCHYRYRSLTCVATYLHLIHKYNAIFECNRLKSEQVCRSVATRFDWNLLTRLSYRELISHWNCRFGSVRSVGLFA